MTKTTDGYLFRQGVAFAREFLETCREAVSMDEPLKKLRASLVNKPPAQAEGIKSIIELLENARGEV